MRLPTTSTTEANGADDSSGDSITDAGSTGVDPAPIAVEDCTLSFGDLAVLEDVSLTVEPGEFVGFVGPNGAGKTTLLRAISGALEPDSGTVTVDGVDVHGVGSKRSSRLVSVVPQDTTLSFSFPVRDVVEMGRHPYRSRFSGPTPADREAVERALERTRTAELADRPIDEISGGQRQRVVLARAIAQETPAMLLDEPTASLDVNHQLETLELVRDLVEDGRTVCAAIHDLDLAARYCDRLVMLADGDVYRSGPPSAVLSGATLAEAFDATATVTRNPVTGTETVTALPRRGSGPADDGESDRLHHARVHVLGAGPIAAGVLARLETAGTDLELSVGPVTAGDTAAETARSLGIDRLEVAPFESLSPPDLAAFENRVREAEATVVTEPVVDASGGGMRRLLEVVDATADAVLVATRSPDRTERGDGAASRPREFVATPETVLEALADALSADSESVCSLADAGPSDTESYPSEDESGSGPGVSAGSSSD